jgi:hypothetical protein
MSLPQQCLSLFFCWALVRSVAQLATGRCGDTSMIAIILPVIFHYGQRKFNPANNYSSVALNIMAK